MTRESPKAPPIPEAFVQWLEHVFRWELTVPTDLAEADHRRMDRNVGIACVIEKVRSEHKRQQHDIRRL